MVKHFIEQREQILANQRDSRMKCPICFETDEFLVGFTCSAGHVICKGCTPKFLSASQTLQQEPLCPTCRSTGRLIWELETDGPRDEHGWRL